MNLRLLKILVIVLILSSCKSKRIEIDYFGQTPPEKEPKIFAPHIISLDDRFEGKGAFSPNGKAFYFTATNNDFSSQKILFSEYKKGVWTKPDTASFSKSYNNNEPFISYDGQKLYFTSDRDKDTISNGRDLYVVEKKDGNWTKPLRLKEPINSEHTELFFNQSKNGTIYFSSNRPNGLGKWDIYYRKNTNGVGDELKNIGSSFNKGLSWDPNVDPDEGFLIFNSYREGDGFGGIDLYISFKENDIWTEPKNMGNQINSEANEYGSFLSPDNKYLFFIRNDGKKSDIYWVDINIINDYR